MALVIVAFFSLKPLEFCGMQEPINTLTGTRLKWHNFISHLNYAYNYVPSCTVYKHAKCSWGIFKETVLHSYHILSSNSHQKQQKENSELMVKGVYGLVRHPMYTGVLIILWSQPTMVRFWLYIIIPVLHVYWVLYTCMWLVKLACDFVMSWVHLQHARGDQYIYMYTKHL